MMKDQTYGPRQTGGYRRILASALYARLGQLQDRIGSLTAAEAFYRKALSRRPGQFDALAGLGRLLLRERRYEEAVPIWRDVVALRPSSASMTFQLSRALHRSGQLDQAAASYLRVVVLDPAHEKAAAAIIDLAKRFAGAHPPGANSPGLQKAAWLGRELLELHSDKGKLSAGVATIAGAICAAARQLAPREPAAALEHFDAALTLAPDLLEAQRGAVLCCERLGDLERAVAILQRRLDANPLAVEARLTIDRLRALLAKVPDADRSEALVKKARGLVERSAGGAPVDPQEILAVLAKARGLIEADADHAGAIDPEEREALRARARGMVGPDEAVDPEEREALRARARRLMALDGPRGIPEADRAATLARADRLLIGRGVFPSAGVPDGLSPRERDTLRARTRHPVTDEGVAAPVNAEHLEALLARARVLAREAKTAHETPTLDDDAGGAGTEVDDSTAGQGADTPISVQRLLQLARAAHEAGRHEDAEALYRAIVDLDAGHVEQRPNDEIRIQALGALSRSYMQQRRFADAVSVLSQLNDLQPGVTGTMQMLGRALLQDGQLSAAAEHYTQFAEFEPESPEVWLSLGRIYRRLGDWEAGRKAWERLLRLEPDQVEARLELAVCCERGGSPEMAETALQQLLEREPDNRRALTILARLRTAKHPEGALACWRRLAALDPEAIEPVLQCARIDLRQGRSDEAEAGFRAVLEREPDNIKALTPLVGIVGKRDVSEAVELIGSWRAIEPASAKPWLALGRLYAVAKQSTKALAAFQRAVELEPADIEGLTGLARSYREAGDYDKALETWAKVAELAPEPLHARLQIARIHFARQDPQVEDVLRSILAVDPNYAEAIRLMGYHYQRQFANFDDALEMWERLATHKAYGVEALIERARLYEKSRRDDLAEVEYKRALALDPRGRLPLSRIGNFYFGLNRFEDALRIYEVHREVEPERTDVIVAMGVCLDRLDRFKEAEDLFARTLEREPDNATVYAYRGRLLRSRGQVDASIADFRRVCALRPESAEAWQELVFYLANAEREEEALATLAEARATLGDIPESLVVLGRAAAAAQMDARAVDYFQQAIAAQPANASFHAELGLHYFRQGVIDGALHHLLDARDLDPRDLKVARALFDTTSLLVELGYDPVELRRGPRTAGKILSPEQLFVHVRKLAEAVEPYDPVPRRVVAISSTLAPGGAERQLVTMMRGLSDPRFNLDLSLFCISLAPRYRRDFFLPALEGTGIDVVLLDMEMVNEYLAEAEVAPFASTIRHFPQDFVAPMAFWLREFRRRRPEVVHAWQDSTNLTAVVAALLAGVPRIILCCRSVRPDNPWRRLRRFMQDGYKAVLDHPSVVLSNNSRAGADSYAEWLDVRTSSIEVVYNGIDFDRLANNAKPEETAQARADLGIPDGAPVLGGVFRMSEEKRPLLWLEVASLVAQANPDAHFVICGDGPMRDRMNDFISEQGLVGRVHLAGARANIGSWYRLMDVVMLTSRHEGLPNVLLEAQSLGIPVVAPNVGGMAEVVEQGVTGWTIKNANAEMLAERVLHCLGDRQWRQAAIERAPRFIRERFGIETMLRRNLEVYGIPVEAGAELQLSGPAQAPVTTARQALEGS